MPSTCVKLWQLDLTLRNGFVGSNPRAQTGPCLLTKKKNLGNRCLSLNKPMFAKIGFVTTADINALLHVFGLFLFPQLVSNTSHKTKNFDSLPRPFSNTPYLVTSVIIATPILTLLLWISQRPREKWIKKSGVTFGSEYLRWLCLFLSLWHCFHPFPRYLTAGSTAGLPQSSNRNQLSSRDR